MGYRWRTDEGVVKEEHEREVAYYCTDVEVLPHRLTMAVCAG